MMIQSRRSRGEPLVALVAVLVLWVGVRALLWNGLDLSIGIEAASVPESGGIALTASMDGERLEKPQSDTQLVPATPRRDLESHIRRRVTLHPPMAFTVRNMGTASRLATGKAPANGYVAAVISHPKINRTILAAPVVSGGTHRTMPRPVSSVGRSLQSDKVWSIDAWLLLRSGGITPFASGVPFATYGASQVGAVLRYRLDRTGNRRLATYLRATAGFIRHGERELAAGLSVRPLARIPVIAAAEIRVTGHSAMVEVRPAALLITELPPFGLPLKIRGEAYGQAGYVGGRYATGFIDGQLRTDHRVVRIGKGELRAGAGAWGGAQRGASRFDIGPLATLEFGLGKNASARLGVDWRFRIAGNAAPASGPAFVLSAGF